MLENDDKQRTRTPRVLSPEELAAAVVTEPLDRPIPVLVNDDTEMYCYRHAAQDMWILRNKLTPDKPNCNACIVSEFGPLPIGRRMWKLSPAAVGKFKGEPAGELCLTSNTS